MITANVIQRTFQIRCGNQTGSAFAIDRGGRQYLITARHVVPAIETGSALDIFYDKQWKTVIVTPAGIGAGETDIAVLACTLRLAPPLPLEATSEGIVYGQETYFLGFPFGWDGGAEDINRDFPVPFVKAGILSSIQSEDPSRFYIDAHGNPGFSGGPLVFKSAQDGSNEFKVAGVVSNAPTPLLTPVVDGAGKPIESAGGAAAFLRENQGFVVVMDIRHATEIIDANPVGFELPGDEVS